MKVTHNSITTGLAALAIALAQPLIAAEPTPQNDTTPPGNQSASTVVTGRVLDAAPANGAKPFLILINLGVYKEHVAIPAEKPFIALRGEPGKLMATVITLGTNVGTLAAKGRTISTRESATVLVQAADFSAENITFGNTTTREQRIQALAMYAEPDRAVF